MEQERVSAHVVSRQGSGEGRDLRIFGHKVPGRELGGGGCCAEERSSLSCLSSTNPIGHFGPVGPQLRTMPIATPAPAQVRFATKHAQWFRSTARGFVSGYPASDSSVPH